MLFLLMNVLQFIAVYLSKLMAHASGQLDDDNLRFVAVPSNGLISLCRPVLVSDIFVHRARVPFCFRLISYSQGFWSHPCFDWALVLM